jgi:predicted Fe-S protein YdhL (DUF1289 family)
MAGAENPAATPRRAPSPCIGICRMDAAGDYCTGCLRTLDEIAAWSTATEEARFAVLRLVAQRRISIKADS